MNIKIKKGLDIRISGTAVKAVSEMTNCTEFAVKPTDFVGVVPRLLVKEGDAVKAGDALFVDKSNADAIFVSPVDGTVKAILRGEKRKLLAVVVEGNADTEPKPLFNPSLLAQMHRDAIIDTMVSSGLWTLLKQRPFGIVPHRDDKPKAVFISAFDSSPLPVDYSFILNKEDFVKGIEILHLLAGKVHLSLKDGAEPSFLDNLPNAVTHHFSGPHPAGLVGTQIAKIDPINKGDTVWVINPQDVSIIGHLFRTGCYRPERIIALCGPVVEKPQYYKTLSGSSIASFSSAVNKECSKLRFISGDVLSGTAISADGFISASTDKVCVLPEGDYYDFMGWLRPNFRKFSFSRTFLSGILAKFNIHGSKFDFDTGRHGDKRPLFVTGEFEKLVPLDIYPMQLIKACIVGDIELMENLGIYEVEPEDLALCEFADTSKTEIQAIIRNALEKIRVEA